jgi:hypothetical protein
MKSARTRTRHRNFHLPLPEDTHEALRLEAQRLRMPATAVAREAIEAWLQWQRRAVVREAIATYAAQHAGSPADLDPALEAAALETWRSRKPRR